MHPRARGRSGCILAAFATMLQAGCAPDGDATSGSARQRVGAESAASTPVRDTTRFMVHTVATGLDTPWDLAFAPDGRIFVSERPGRIRVVHHGRLAAEPWATVDVAAEDETGLTGIVLAPDFERSRHVYVIGTFRTPSRDLVNRVIRFTDRDGKGSDPTVIVDSIPAANYHSGAAIAFGPDGMLYVGTGDARDPDSAQDPESLAGKILRFEATGRIPADNPVRGSPVWALGLRNPQGLAWEPWTNQLFAIDHGPSGLPSERLRRHHDELNAIRAGGNYGWPTVAGQAEDPRFVAPMFDWTPGIAPAGLAVYTGKDFPSWRGHLFVGALRGAHLRRIAVARGSGGSSGWRVTSEQVMVTGLGRIRAVQMGRDGYLYFTTSNRDGRGAADSTDDRLLRLVPAP